MSTAKKGFAAGLAAGLVIAVALLALVAPLQDLLPAAGTQSRSDQAREIIGDSYFRETDEEKLEDASVAGMVRKISRENEDKFSHYFDPAAYKRFRAASSGQFSGIGLNVTESKRGLRIARVFDGTPAQAAGLAVGDEIVAVEGKSIAGSSATAASSQIKGRKGTEVTITVVAGRSGKRRVLDVERAEVRIPAVESRMERRDGSEIAYVRLASFTPGAHGELRNAISKLRADGAEGLILDLRGNGGGLLDEAVLVTSLFQDSGPVVTIEGRARAEQTIEATGGAIDPIPTAVLVDGSTASASEILTAALQQNDLATVIGTRTFGKGVFQEVIELDAGGALDITVGEYLTSDGTSILGTGVVPDQRVEDGDLESGGDAVLDAGLRQVASELGSG
ncbi:MAG: S41 family peptidase [Actinomycetota bacterium]|nr:S41 family peptidase [Actinomycetota bacterium]